MPINGMVNRNSIALTMDRSLLPSKNTCHIQAASAEYPEGGKNHEVHCHWR